MVTKKQIKKIYTLLHAFGIDENGKEAIVLSYTGDRTYHVSEMTAAEASAMLSKLVSLSKRENVGRSEKSRLKAAIFKLGFEMGLLFGSSEIEMKLNAAKIDIFCKNRGTVKKDLSKQTVAELKRTHRQFEAMLTKHKAAQDKIIFLETLKASLQEYIKSEQYELCAVLKKEIDRLTK